jgi:signal recognition particle subunit SRP54
MELFLTKLDGDTRGGAFSIKSVVNKPIKFVGTGEKNGSNRCFLSRSYGRAYSWNGRRCVERAQEQFDEEEARKFKRKLLKTNLVLMISYSNSTSKENG